MERDLIRERTKSAMAIEKTNGQRVGTLPYGYESAKDGSTLVAAEQEQAVLASIPGARGRPFGNPTWTQRTIARLGRQSSIRLRGRPRKQPHGKA